MSNKDKGLRAFLIYLAFLAGLVVEHNKWIDWEVLAR